MVNDIFPFLTLGTEYQNFVNCFQIKKKKKEKSAAYPELYALHVISVFYTTYVGLWNKEDRSIPHGQLPLTGEVKPEVSGDCSFSVIDSS